MKCSSDNKFVSVKGYLSESLTVSGFNAMGLHSLIPMGLRCADCFSEQASLLLVSLVKGSEG